MGRNKGKPKILYFSEEEWTIILKKSKDLNMNTSNYIKRMALKGYIIEYNLDKINDLIYEINKIGVNINQIAKKANETDNVYKSDIEELQRRMDELWHILKSYLLKLQ